MRRRNRWGLLLVLVTVGWLAADSALFAGMVKNSERTQSWEFTIPIRYINGTGADFNGGTSIDFDDDVGFGFGFGYNFNELFNLDFEISWMDAGYQVEFASADTPPLASVKATGEMSASNSSFNFTYNILRKTITPYVSASLGWTWVDTNIPSGTPDVGCWWNPWYGQICTAYQDTFEDERAFVSTGRRRPRGGNRRVSSAPGREQRLDEFSRL